MTWEQTFLEWLKALGTVVAACSLLFGFLQLRRNMRWNRINATFTYLPEMTYLAREREAANALGKVSVDLYKQDGPLADSAVTKILDDSLLFREVKDFLNLFEDYAKAYWANAIDREQSYLSSVSRFIRNFDIFKPVIVAVREQRKRPHYWLEFENLVTKWQKRQAKER
jgi:Domain of unknown function (DUF4760)